LELALKGNIKILEMIYCEERGVSADHFGLRQTRVELQKRCLDVRVLTGI
jgi:hypothetical protein